MLPSSVPVGYWSFNWTEIALQPLVYLHPTPTHPNPRGIVYDIRSLLLYNLKYEDDLEYEDDLKYEDNLKYKDNLKSVDDLKNENDLKYVDKPQIWRQPQIWRDLKFEDNLKYEENLKYGDNLYDMKMIWYEDGLKFRDNLCCTKPNEIYYTKPTETNQPKLPKQINLNLPWAWHSSAPSCSWLISDLLFAHDLFTTFS